MAKLTFSNLSKAELKRLVNLQEKPAQSSYPWLQVEDMTLTAVEQQRLQFIQSDLVNLQVHLMNEPTLWARAIYPLLLLAERDSIQAWAGVPLYARYAQFEIEGVADGVLGKAATGFVEAPFFVVVETKRGVENQNPLFQLYGQLLAAAWLNWETEKLPLPEVFGCYTIADVWTFVRAEVEGIEQDMPTLRVEYSQEYGEKCEAETILKILKKIIGLKQDRR